MNLEDFLIKITESSGVSGFEQPVSKIIENFWGNYTDRIKKDKLGNLVAYKKGASKNPIRIMLAAHMDEIGLIVKDIDEKGFIKFTNIGGIDERTLLAQEVIIHGTKDILGIIGAKPPHLQSPEERKKTMKINELVIDIGYSKEKAQQFVSIGTPITIKRKSRKLQGEIFAAKSLDDRAGIATMIECFKELAKINHQCDIYGVATVQEEVGTRGAITSTFDIQPDIGIAIDVGFGATPDLPKDETLDLGKGPGLSFGPNIHPKIYDRLVEVAKDYNIPYQMDLIPGKSGTDAQVMQISRFGIATGLISIPLRYMHTSVETIHMKDIKNAGKLLAYFISSLDNESLEGFLCF